MKRWTRLITAAAAVVAVACGSDLSSPLEGGPSASKGTTGGTDSSSGGGGGGGGGGQTSNGPVASVTVTPRTASLPMTYYLGLTATARDAAGVRVVKQATWRSSNPAVVTVVGDTGVLYGKALGTAKIYATIDGFTDSATVTVIPTPVTPTPQNPPTAAAEFNMTVVTFGRLPGADTSKTERVPGATVALMRIGGIRGDTLTTPVDAGSAVADANGEAKFSRLVGGSYSIRITPPAGSAYAATSSAIGPPSETDIRVHVTMVRP